MPQPKGEIGVVGLGPMGRNLAFNSADHGFPVAPETFHTQWDH